MNEMVKEIQRLSYKILVDIHEFCVENGIMYFLSSGSVLGAVRHQGFIPWDDDIDIMMPRKDYDAFIAAYQSRDNGQYILGSLQTDLKWINPFAKVWDPSTSLKYKHVEAEEIGVFVDVFPIDGIPDGSFKRKCFLWKLRMLNIFRNAAMRKSFYEHERWRTIKKVLGRLLNGIGARYFAQKMEKEARKHPFETCETVAAILAANYWQKEFIARENMASAIDLPFETGSFPVPIGYEVYLRNLYGDYMKLPDPDQRKAHLEGSEFVLERKGQ